MIWTPTWGAHSQVNHQHFWSLQTSFCPEDLPRNRLISPHLTADWVWRSQTGSECKQLSLPYRMFDGPTDLPMLKPIFFFASSVVLYLFALCLMCIATFQFSHSGQSFLIIFRYTRVGIFHLTVHTVLSKEWSVFGWNSRIPTVKPSL